MLYCPHCNEYQGSLGSDVCVSCGHTEELEDSTMSVLFCPRCESYLGSLGASHCSCGWPQDYKEEKGA